MYAIRMVIQDTHDPPEYYQNTRKSHIENQ